MRYVVGVDVGGTNLVAGVVAEDGSEIHGVVSEPTLAGQGADPVIARTVKLAKASIKESGKKVEGAGIGSPGPLNTKTGVVLLTPNLGWTNMPLRDRVGEGLGRAGREVRHRAHAGDRYRRRHRHRRRDLPWRHRRRGRVRARLDRRERPALQMRELRLHRSLRVRPRDRDARDRRHRVRHRDIARAIRQRRFHQDHRTDRLRGRERW